MSPTDEQAVRDGRITMANEPLCILAFDHRTTFRRRVGDPPPRRSGDTDELITGCKRILFEAFERALDSGAVPEDAVALIIDEEHGAELARAAEKRGFRFGMPVERTEQKVFAFEYGAQWREHVERFDADFYKSLARWNPTAHEVNRQQAEGLAELSGWLRKTGRGMLLELLVEPTAAQLDDLGGARDVYDIDHRPAQTVEAMRQIHAAGIVPDIWKIEGVGRRSECEAIGRAATAHPDAPDACCVVLGRGADDDQVRAWLAASAGVPGYAGFALGRNLFWGALGAWLAEEIEAPEAAQQVADAYADFVGFYRSRLVEAR